VRVHSEGQDYIPRPGDPLGTLKEESGTEEPISLESHIERVRSSQRLSALASGDTASSAASQAAMSEGQELAEQLLRLSGTPLVSRSNSRVAARGAVEKGASSTDDAEAEIVGVLVTTLKKIRSQSILASSSARDGKEKTSTSSSSGTKEKRKNQDSSEDHNITSTDTIVDDLLGNIQRIQSISKAISKEEQSSLQKSNGRLSRSTSSAASSLASALKKQKSRVVDPLSSSSQSGGVVSSDGSVLPPKAPPAMIKRPSRSVNIARSSIVSGEGAPPGRLSSDEEADAAAPAWYAKASTAGTLGESRRYAIEHELEAALQRVRTSLQMERRELPGGLAAVAAVPEVQLQSSARSGSSSGRGANEAAAAAPTTSSSSKAVYKNVLYEASRVEKELSAALTKVRAVQKVAASAALMEAGVTTEMV
ncbi:unnamed protein product, partial [Amoebophrya sp. A25]